jgi:uncharacterized protein (TIGR00290 family)
VCDLDKVALSWSGGKDCALALYEIQQHHQYEVTALLTTITQDYNRISMHGVRLVLLERQAEAVKLPLKKVFVPANCTNEMYAEIMEKEMLRLKSEGINTVAFGDIFLQDVREYRENNLAKVGMKAIFPLWGRNSLELVKSFINLGFKAVITTIDPRKLNKEFCGSIIDASFLDSLPQDVDAAGENGEFHSFVFNGSVFKSSIRFTVGEKVFRDGFWFCDLMPVD